MLRAVLFMIAISALPASAADLYYLAPGSNDFGATLYDMPRSLALARCYGRYDSAARDKQKGAAAMRKTVGAMLNGAVNADRGVALKLNQLRPRDMDMQTGLMISTDAPEDIYEFYWRGFNDMAKDKIAPLSACDVLLTDSKAQRNFGKAAEPLHSNQPMVLALAHCYGQWRFVRSRIAPKDPLDVFNPSRDPNGFAKDGERLEAALIRVAQRDRNLALVITPYPKGLKLPAAIWDAYVAGWTSVDNGRPDFPEMMPSDYQTIRENCLRVTAAAG